jgi:hypothetical protein
MTVIQDFLSCTKAGHNLLFYKTPDEHCIPVLGLTNTIIRLSSHELSDDEAVYSSTRSLRTQSAGW